MKLLTKTLLILSIGLLISCAKRTPEPFTLEEFNSSSDKDLAKIKEIKDSNEIFNEDLKVDLYTAIAIAIDNNKDLNVKLLETSLANNQIKDVEFNMLPKMAANAGYTSSTKYKASTSATVSNSDVAGAKGTTFSTSSEKNVLEQDVGFTWNVLDFGLSYIRAGQNADRYLIATELEKKASNNIARDVIRAYWNALSAKKLEKKYEPLLEKVNKALNNSKIIEELLLQKPMDALLYQKELLDIHRSLQTQKQSFVNAKIELGSLMGLLPNEKFEIVLTEQPLSELQMKLTDMEEFALINRPELIENQYVERISTAETKAGIRALMPGLNFNATWTNSSNDYLMNKDNFEYGSSIGANLFNVFRAPIINKVNKLNTKIIQEQRLALSMTVLSQVHISNIEYQSAIEEYDGSDRYYDVAEKITDQVRNAQKIARFGELELIREEASLLVAELRRDIAYTKLQYSIANIYNSVGINLTEKSNPTISTKEYAKEIKKRFQDYSKEFRYAVNYPINQQNPVVVFKDKNNGQFTFSKDTFDMEGRGQVKYYAKQGNNEPLPNWINFLPSQRIFIVNRENAKDIADIELIVGAKNINNQIEDKFTLVIDPELSKQKLAKAKSLKKQETIVEPEEIEVIEITRSKKLEEERQARLKKLEEEKQARIKKLEDEKQARLKKLEEAKKVEEQEKIAKLKKLEEQKQARLKKLEEQKQARLKKLEEQKQARLKKLEEQKQAKLKKLEEQKQARLKKIEEAKKIKEQKKLAKLRKLEEKRLAKLKKLEKQKQARLKKLEKQTPLDRKKQKMIKRIENLVDKSITKLEKFEKKKEKKLKNLVGEKRAKAYKKLAKQEREIVRKFIDLKKKEWKKFAKMEEKEKRKIINLKKKKQKKLLRLEEKEAKKRRS